MKELVTPLSHTWITHDELGKLNTIKYNISDEDFVDILVNVSMLSVVAAGGVITNQIFNIFQCGSRVCSK